MIVNDIGSADHPVGGRVPHSGNRITTSSPQRIPWRVARIALLASIALMVALAFAATTAGATGMTDDGNHTLEIVANTSTEEVVTVDLRTSASGVAGYQTTFTYDSDVLSVTSVEGVELNDPVTNTDRTGSVSFTQSQRTGVDQPTLATIAFEVVGDDSTTIGFVEDYTIVHDENGSHLDVTLEALSFDGDEEPEPSGSFGGGDRGTSTESSPGGSDSDERSGTDSDSVETAVTDAEDHENVEVNDDLPTNQADDNQDEGSDDERTDDEERPSNENEETAVAEVISFVPGGAATVVVGLIVLVVGVVSTFQRIS